MSSEVQSGGPLQHLQLKDRVYEYLRRAIIDGEYEVGAALREVDISTSLSVSKTPVREAFVRLQADRFVELVPYRGAIVTGYTRRDLREVYEVRELIQGRCAARAAEARNDELCEALQRNVDDTRKAIDSGRVDEIVTLFESFDRLVYAQSENRWMTDIVKDLEGHQRRIGRHTVDIPGRIELSVEEHEAICTAIVRQDAAGAENAMRAHVRSVMSDQLRTFVGDDGKPGINGSRAATSR